jgi:DNA-binding SARP family transcriptional activator
VLHGDGSGAELTLQLFGWWHLTRGGAPLTLGRREQRLTSFLALRGTRTRSHVAGSLWPDGGEDKARNNLRAAVLHVKERVPDLLLVTRPALGLADCVRVDVHDYLDQLRLAETARDERAMTTILGGDHDLLPGWYDDWVILEREQLQLVRLRTLQRIARHALESGDSDTAILTAHEAVRLEPLYEPAHATLIRAHLADGDPAGAVRQYRRLARALASELGIGPSPQVEELVRPVISGDRRNHRRQLSPSYRRADTSLSRRRPDR